MKREMASQAFTLVENVIATALFSLLSLGLVGLMIVAMRTTKNARENVNAAEVAEAKLEALRSCTWSQLSSNGFVPNTFKVTNGIVYGGTINLYPSAISENYSNRLVEAVVNVTWIADGRPRNLKMSTYLSEYGISNP